MATVAISKNKDEFISQLHSIALGEKQTYDGMSGQTAIEKILSSNNHMTAIVKYDALLNEIMKEHNIRAKKYIPKLCGLLKDAGMDERKVVSKLLRDFEHTWSRATVYNHIPQDFKRHYSFTPKSKFRHYDSERVGYCLKCDAGLMTDNGYIICENCGAFMFVT